MITMCIIMAYFQSEKNFLIGHTSLKYYINIPSIKIIKYQCKIFSIHMNLSTFIFGQY